MKTCSKCYKDFIPKKQSSKYCSYSCYLTRSGLPKFIEKECLYCHKKFQARSKLKNKKCCSLKCTSLYGWSLKGHRKTFTKPCDVCGNIMETRPDRVEDGRGKYCSKRCYIIAMKSGKYAHTMPEKSREKLSEKRLGKLNPAYIHGKSYTFTHYNSGFNHILKDSVFKRDKNICQKCGKIGGKRRLDIHHIDLNQTHNFLNNLVTLCRMCHKYFH